MISRGPAGPLWRPRWMAAGLGFLLLLLGACSALNPSALTGAGSSSRPTTVKVGQAAPEINLKSLTGDQIVLSQLQGRPVIVNFWATWCGPCREEFPTLVRKYKQYQNQGLVIIGVNYQDENSDDGVRTFMRNTLVNFPIVRDQDGRVGEMYRISGLPTSIFIDRKGIVRDIIVGGPMTDDFVDKEVANLQ
ncbi:MAG: TlpA family protein disulfide reductase [Chloroflexi bacterium]|nr:TlpA family protein disulfide reductase [Chloroflexota bacterium]